jgi:hypothetical protein
MDYVRLTKIFVSQSVTAKKKLTVSFLNSPSSHSPLSTEILQRGLSVLHVLLYPSNFPLGGFIFYPLSSSKHPSLLWTSKPIFPCCFNPMHNHHLNIATQLSRLNHAQRTSLYPGSLPYVLQLINHVSSPKPRPLSMTLFFFLQHVLLVQHLT